MTEQREWKGVPLVSGKQWMCMYLSEEFRDVPGACPISREHTLDQWFDRSRPFTEAEERSGYQGWGAVGAGVHRATPTSIIQALFLAGGVTHWMSTMTGITHCPEVI